MKKRFTLLCLLCVLCMLTGAAAAPGDAYLFNEDHRKALGIDIYNTPTMAVVEDMIYALFGPDIYAWQPGMDDPQQVASNLAFGYYSTYEEAQASEGVDAAKLIQSLVSDGETVFGLNTLNGYLYPLTFNDGLAEYGTPIELDWSEIDDIYNQSNYAEILSTCYSSGFLYTLVRNGDDYENPVLISFDLSTGNMERLDVEYLQSIAPYKDGMLVCEVYNRQEAFDSETGEMENPTVAIYNPADGSVTQAGTFGHNNLSGIAYYAQNDTLYYTTNSMLMAMPALGEATQVAFMPVSYASDAPAVVLPGGLYAINLWDGLIVRNTDPSYMPTVSLSVYGGYIDDAATAFMSQHPDVPLNFSQDLYFESATALAQAMVSGDNTFDIYYFDLSYQDFTSLMEKGYCLDLSPYTDITDQLAAMYPFIQSAISNNGAFYAIPTGIYSNGLCIYKSTWDDNGLTDRIPTTLMEVIDFIKWWADEGISEYPDLQLYEYAYDYRQTLFRMVFEQYIAKCQAEGEDITLNTPILREMLSALETIDYDALNDTIPDSEDGFEDMSYEEMVSSCLLTDYGELLSARAREDYTSPLVIPMQDGDEIHLPTNLSCVFINPNTQNQELSVQYLRSVLENMSDIHHIMMFPDDNEPVPNAYYEERIDSYEEMLAESKAKLETAAPEDVKDIQSTIDRYQELIDNKDDYYWDASSESIANYRELAQYAYTVTPTLLSYSGNEDAAYEIQTLISRYLQEQMTLDQFITQADQKLRMIRLERE